MKINEKTVVVFFVVVVFCFLRKQWSISGSGFFDEKNVQKNNIYLK